MLSLKWQRTLLTILLSFAPFVALAIDQPEPPQSLEQFLKSFDCDVRQRAVEYAVKLQPFRGKSTLGHMVESLNQDIGLPGAKTRCFNTKLPENLPENDIVDPISIPNGAKVVVVDPINGNDDVQFQKKGSHQIFETIERALDWHRQERERSSKNRHMVIVLKEGVHRMNKTIVLTSKDSNFTLTCEAEKKCIVSGAKSVRGEWEKSSAMKNVWEMNLSGTGIDQVPGLRIGNQRAVRARFPNGCFEAGLNCRGNMRNGAVVDPKDGYGTQVRSDWIGSETPKNWYQYNSTDAPHRTDTDYFSKYNLGIYGGCSNFTPPAGYWCGANINGGASSKFTKAKGVRLDKMTHKPNYPYSKPKGMIVFAFHSNHWGSRAFQVSHSEENDQVLMFDKGGIQEARGENGGGELIIENAIEELDADNEYYFDNESNLLYYYLESDAPPSFEKKVEITHLKTLIKLEGTQEQPVKNVLVHGISFEDSAISFMGEFTAPAGGDWAVGLHGAIMLRGVKNIKIVDCSFEKLDGTAIFVKGFARNVVIERNFFLEMGESAIVLLGETEAPGIPKSWGIGWDGRAGNQPRGTKVLQNVFRYCGLYLKQTSFFFQSKSMQTIFDANIMMNGPRAAININDGFGGSNVISRNIAFHLVQETGDHGIFNSWDRQPYVYSNANDGVTPIMIKKPDEIKFNMFFGDGFSFMNIDTDDGSSWFNVHDNVLMYCLSGGLKSDFAAHNIYHSNNTYLFVSTAICMMANAKLQGILPGHNGKFLHNRAVMNNTVDRVYRYPCPCEVESGNCPIIENNHIYTVDGFDLPDTCGMYADERANKGIEKNLTISKWPSVKVMMEWINETLPDLRRTPSQRTKSTQGNFVLASEE